MQRLLHRKDGFTLIELMIVIAIIAILATILIVQWVGAREAAADSETLMVARNAGLATYIYFIGSDSLEGLTQDALGAIEPSLAIDTTKVPIDVNTDTENDTFSIIVGPNPPGKAMYDVTHEGISDPYYD